MRALPGQAVGGSRPAGGRPRWRCKLSAAALCSSGGAVRVCACDAAWTRLETTRRCLPACCCSPDDDRGDEGRGVDRKRPPLACAAGVDPVELACVWGGCVGLVKACLLGASGLLMTCTLARQQGRVFRSSSLPPALARPPFAGVVRSLRPRHAKSGRTRSHNGLD